MIRSLILAGLLMLFAAPTLAAPTPAAPAPAAVAQCLWERLPETDREAVLAQYKLGMREGMDALQARNDRILAAGEVCAGRPDVPPLWLQASIVGHLMREGSSLFLLEQRGLPRNILDRLWREAPEASRGCTRFEAARPLKLELPACPDKEAARWFLTTLEVENTDAKGATEALTYYYGVATGEVMTTLLTRFAAEPRR